MLKESDVLMAYGRARSTFDTLIAVGRPPVGAFVMSTDAAVTGIYGAAGYDWVLIDREHGIMDNGDMRAHLMAAKAHNLVSIVRVLENNAAMIQQALDAGANALMIPKVDSAESARRAVAASQYQAGGRGMCPVVPATDFTGAKWDEYASDANQNVLVIPLIETAKGVENIDEICSTDGVDYVFFGLADLSQDLGIDMLADMDVLVRLWKSVVEAAHRHGVKAGAPLGYGFDAEADFGSLDSDLSTLRSSAERALETFYESRAESLARG